jgi:septin 3/9/12
LGTNREIHQGSIFSVFKKGIVSIKIYIRTPQREQRINDTRVHVVLYFIAPTGHALTPLDITVMKKISKIANLVPVIAKSDSLMADELIAFKKRIKSEIEFHGITIYPQSDVDEDVYEAGSEAEKASKLAFQEIKVVNS